MEPIANFTPDFSVLDDEAIHLVVDVGPINNDLPAYSTVYTVEKMALWKGAGFAVPIRMEGASHTRVTGTLHRVSGEELLALDKRKQNGVWFNREKIPVLHKVQGTIWAWFYVGNNAYWEERIRFEITHRNGSASVKPAPRFIDNDPRFHLASAYDGKRVEDYDRVHKPVVLPPDVVTAMRALVKAKNDAEIKRLHDEQEAQARMRARLAAPFYKRILMPK
jgi:hypothetical protein